MFESRFYSKAEGAMTSTTLVCGNQDCGDGTGNHYSLSVYDIDRKQCIYHLKFHDMIQESILLSISHLQHIMHVHYTPSPL